MNRRTLLGRIVAFAACIVSPLTAIASRMIEIGPNQKIHGMKQIDGVYFNDDFIYVFYWVPDESHPSGAKIVMQRQEPFPTDPLSVNQFKRCDHEPELQKHLASKDIGNTVMLNSGGPKMKIIQTSDTIRFVTCAWVNSNGLEQQATFPEACVRHVNHYPDVVRKR